MNGTIRTITLATALAVTLAATGTACTGTKEQTVTLPSAAATPTSASGSTASPSQTATPEQQVLAAYLGLQNAFDKASQTANPDDPNLPKFATGEALTLLRNGLSTMREQGLLARGQTVFHPTVESLSPPAAPRTARIRDCMDTRNDIAYKANGEPYKDTPGGFRLVIADLARTNGVWKVTGMGVHEVGSCVL